MSDKIEMILHLPSDYSGKLDPMDKMSEALLVMTTERDKLKADNDRLLAAANKVVSCHDSGLLSTGSRDSASIEELRQAATPNEDA